MRLDKFLGCFGTRSEIKKLLKSGAATVDGVVVKDGGFQVNIDSNVVFFRGKQVLYKEFIYLVMNKPQGYISATSDKSLPVVTELIGEEYKHYSPFPVGRLDIDTEGLLILTNDGTLSHELTAPKKDVKKRYFAVTDIPMDTHDAETFLAGMALGDFTAKPAELEFTSDPLSVYITISEGKYHQVKRMCKKCGKHVVFLRRTAIGGLVLPSELKCGESFEITRDELCGAIYGKEIKNET